MANLPNMRHLLQYVPVVPTKGATADRKDKDGTFVGRDWSVEST
jgi:hypothetical protein